jgi:hypothetical protein
MSITMPGIMTDSEQPPLRLISRWKYDPASDSFHIGRGWYLSLISKLGKLGQLQQCNVQL